MGEQETTLKKKRQFQIVNGKIRNMFDTNETVGDEMLQSALGAQNDDYMQNIVATIQHEQNDIIRDTKSNLLVVQALPDRVRPLQFFNELRFYSITAATL